MSEDIRAFVAVRLSPELLAVVQKLQERLERELKCKAIRWTKPEQLHLTLWFLGNVPAEKLADLQAAMQAGCAGCKPMTLSLEKIGCFPSFSRPNVVWLGVGGEVEALQNLAARLIDQVRTFGEHDEKRPFKAHLTIARFRDAAPRELERVGTAISAMQVTALGQWTAASVELIRSELSPKGPTYTMIEEVKL